MIALWLAACAKPPPVPVAAEAPAAEAPAPVAPAPSADRVPILGPRYWSEPGGLCLDKLPEGFSGTIGPPPVVLDVQDPDGFGFQIRVGPADEPLPERTGYALLFESTGSYRSVPLLAPNAVSRTWVADPGDGEVIQTWSNRLGNRTVEIAAVYPRGRVTEGEAALAPLLAALCQTAISFTVPPEVRVVP